MSGVLLPVFIIILLLSVPSYEVEGESSQGPQPPTRSLVTIPVEHIKIISGGISQWGPYSLGQVNRTTTISMRLKNTQSAPFTGIEVKLTLYWYDANTGFSFDRGRVMYRQDDIASVPAGDGALSDPVLFKWVPTFAGAYVMNLSIHIPGDPRPISNRTLFAGIKYVKSNGDSITDGLWVGTESWDCSDMDGWTSYSDPGEPGMEWHSSDHPLSQGYESLHTPGGSFWVGDPETGLPPTTGSYSLVSPSLDLRDFHPEPWDNLISKKNPMIFLLYKYRGNITTHGPNGWGGIYHWVRTLEGSDWGDWEVLRDPFGHWVNITGNQTNRIWDWSERPFTGDRLNFVGVDLGAYQGKMIQLRFEYLPSGINESGYVIDDVMIIGKDRVDISPYSLTYDAPQGQTVNPGSRVLFNFEVESKLKETDEDVTVRIEMEDGSDFLDLQRGVDISPSISTLKKNSNVPLRVNISLDIPISAPSGPGWCRIVVIGGGISRSLTFEFNVATIRLITLELEGYTEGPILPGSTRHPSVRIMNQGNVRELVRISYLTDSDLKVLGNLGSHFLDTDASISIPLNASVPIDTRSGEKKGYIVVSFDQLPENALEMIQEERGDPSWRIGELVYQVDQVHSLTLLTPSPASNFREIEEPSEEGSAVLVYDLILQNLGNGRDNVSIINLNWGNRSDISLDLPSRISIEPGITEFLKVKVVVHYPVPKGIYTFEILAESSGEESRTDDNQVQLRLSIGRAPVSSGIYLLNGSLEIIPDDIIMGEETVVAFTVRSFGFLQSESFTVNLALDGKVVLSQPFSISPYQDRYSQIPWTFDTPGTHNITINLMDSKDLGEDAAELVVRMGATVEVGFIELGVRKVYLRSGDDVEGSDQIRPGTYDVVVEVENDGDSQAELITLTLSLLDRKTETRWNMTQNLTELMPNSTKELVFKNVRFEPEREYLLLVSIDNIRWKELDVDDNLIQKDLNVGTIPPDEPRWKNPIWGIIGFTFTFFITLAIFLYLVRKKF
ncbi:MAG: hypothetical protein ACMUHB_02935 [Thermoplasmatota archaeon]